MPPIPQSLRSNTTLLACALAAGGLAACANSPPNANNQMSQSTPVAQGGYASQPGGARLMRLAQVQGTAWLSSAGQAWGAALVNRPLVAGDRLTTEAGARAELQMGGAVLRLGERSDLSLIRTDEGALEAHLEAGSLALRLPHGAVAQQVLLRTRDADLRPAEAGVYRIDRWGRGTFAGVVQGSLTVSAPGLSRVVSAGQRVELVPSGSQVVAQAATWPQDQFDAWARSADAAWEQALAQGVSPDMTGTGELSQYGRWRTVDEYGSVWFPSVGAGWSPYQSGQWAWVNPWGWTWVDSSPWGFAPYNYGQWVFVGGTWAWWPGGTYQPPYPPYPPPPVAVNPHPPTGGVNQPQRPTPGVTRPGAPGLPGGPGGLTGAVRTPSGTGPGAVNSGRGIPGRPLLTATPPSAVTPAVRQPPALPQPALRPRVSVPVTQGEGAPPNRVVPGPRPIVMPAPQPAMQPGLRTPGDLRDGARPVVAPAPTVAPAPAPVVEREPRNVQREVEPAAREPRSPGPSGSPDSMARQRR